jgi:tetratricopeptide (TPR) repeat protein
LFNECLEQHPQHPVVLLHFAEYHIHSNTFDEATRILRRTQRSMSSYSPSWTMEVPEACHPYWSTLMQEQRAIIEQRKKQATSPALVISGELYWTEVMEGRIDESFAHLKSNVYALLGVCMFRENPTKPELSLSQLEEGLVLFPKSNVLLLCSGEVHSQCGDMARSIKLFQQAAGETFRENVNENKDDDWSHPLPWVNAARTYQQLGQLSAAQSHLSRALALDPSLAMTRVDEAQLHRQQGDINRAVVAIEEAMQRSRQVSEIRDVLTARYVVLLQQSLKDKGLDRTNIAL